MKNRFIQDITLTVPAGAVEELMQNFLSVNCFYETEWNGEACWAADNGLCEKYRMFLYSYEYGVLHIEAWLRSGKNGEYSLNGWGAMIDRKNYMDLMQLLIERALVLIPYDRRPRVEDVLSAADKRAIKRYRIVWPLVMIAVILFVMVLPYVL